MLNLQSEEFARNDPFYYRDVDPRYADLDALAVGFDPQFVALFPAVFGIDRAEVFALAAAEGVRVVEVGFHVVGDYHRREKG